MKTRRRVHRRRYHPSAVDRYQLERYLQPLYEGVKTVEQLRERFRKFVEDQRIWDAIAGIQKAAEVEQAALNSLNVAVKRAFLPSAPPRPKRKKAA